MHIIRFTFILCLLMALGSCTENTGTATATDANIPEASPAKPVDTFVVEPESHSGNLTELFTYHRKLTLNPDVTFDVLGLGKPSVGSYLILKSDKQKGTYASITGDKKGQIMYAYATDMDTDKQIEVMLVIKAGKNRQGNLIIHEIDSLNNHTKITLPELSTDLAVGYQGQDTFYVKGNRIIREFPVAVNSGGGKTNKKQIQYVLKNNALLPSAEGKK